MARREEVESRNLSAEYALIERCVRLPLQRWEPYFLEDDQVALAGYWHLGARLGQERLDACCDDGQGKTRLLRVCQLKGNVFRGRKDRRYDKRLPNEPVQSEIGSRVVAGYLGPIYRPSRRVDEKTELFEPDRFGRAARTPRVYRHCVGCGELFTASTSREYCGNACRKRHSRANASSQTAR